MEVKLGRMAGKLLHDCGSDHRGSSSDGENDGLWVYLQLSQ